MADYRPKISSLVSSQLPEHIRNEQPAFVAFLEAYYRYLEQNELNLSNLRDIDKTLDSFVTYFKDELGQNIPYSNIDERFLLQHIKDLYLSKGSEASFDLLFKILFNKNVTLDYPSKQMLRASDGKWNQDISVFVELQGDSDPNDIVGKLVDVITPNRIIRVLIDRRQYVEVEVERAIKVSENIYELILDRRFFGDINVGDRLRYRDDFSGIFFSGDVLATTASLEVQQKGTGFKVGEIYDIRNFDGYGTKMKISSVDNNGGIIAAEFIKYGIGYSTEFTSTLIPKAGQAEDTKAGTSVLRVLNNLNITDRMGGFSEVGTVNYQTYFDTTDSGGYADGTYAGEVQREFGITTTDAQVSSETPAIIKVGLGAVANYPGYYINNDGFLDDAIYIQDSRYYQAFSYLVKIDETLEEYQSAVKTLIHPAGMALFGEYDIRNEFNIGLTLESLIKILNITAQDEVFSTEQIALDALNAAIAQAGVTKGIGQNTPLYAPYLDSVTAYDDNSFSLTDTAGSLTTRTNPDYQLAKALYNGEDDYDLNAADHTVTMTENLSYREIGKGLSATSTDFDGNIDDETVVMVSQDLTVTGGLEDNTDVIQDFGKSLLDVYPGVTELAQATMGDGSNRFGISIIEMEKEVTDAPIISEALTWDLELAVIESASTVETDEVSLLTSKPINSSSTNYDGDLDDETFSVSESNIIDLSKPLSDSQVVTEVSQTTMADGLARFGLSAIDSDKELTTSYGGMIDTDAADETDLNRTVPAFEIGYNIPGTHDVTFSESGIINKNPYGEAGYFLNDSGVYVSDNYSTF